ncbi:uncharacterized protein LOC125537170, partial [Triticum urartu]
AAGPPPPPHRAAGLPAPRPFSSPPRPPLRAVRVHTRFADEEAQAAALRARAGRLECAPPTATSCSTLSSSLRATAVRRRRTRGRRDSVRISPSDPAEAYDDTDVEALSAAVALYAPPLLAEPCLSVSPSMYAAGDPAGPSLSARGSADSSLAHHGVHQGAADHDPARQPHLPLPPEQGVHPDLALRAERQADRGQDHHFVP